MDNYNDASRVIDGNFDGGRLLCAAVCAGCAASGADRRAAAAQTRG